MMTQELCDKLARELGVHETNLQRARWKIEDFAREIRKGVIEEVASFVEKVRCCPGGSIHVPSGIRALAPKEAE
jgi:hypothetical protein